MKPNQTKPINTLEPPYPTRNRLKSYHCCFRIKYPTKIDMPLKILTKICVCLKIRFRTSTIEQDGGGKRWNRGCDRVRLLRTDSEYGPWYGCGNFAENKIRMEGICHDLRCVQDKAEPISSITPSFLLCYMPRKCRLVGWVFMAYQPL